MFTTPCFIRKNTTEIQDRLEELGYVSMYGYKIKGIEIYTSAKLGVFFIPVSDDLPELTIDRIEDFDKLIDCGDNEELFLVIAALRDDLDEHQWFTDGNKWIQCPEIKFSNYLAYNDIDIDVNKIHKATVKELIEHFKN